MNLKDQQIHSMSCNNNLILNTYLTDVIVVFTYLEVLLADT